MMLNSENTIGLPSTIEVPAPEFPWRKNLYVIWFAQFIAMIGMNACIPFLPLYIRQLGVTNIVLERRWSGIIFAAPFILAFLVTPIWGALGDKYGKKLMVVRAILGLTVAMLLMALAQNIWHLFFLRVLQGGISGFIAANLALVSSCTPKEHGGYAIGILQTATSAGVTLGPMLGGMFADAFGVRQSFFFVAFLCLMSAIIVIIFAKEKKIACKSRKKLNFGIIWQNPKIFQILWFIAVCQTAVTFTTPILAYYLESLHTPKQYLATITGVMVGSVGFLMLISTPYWGRRNDRLGYERNLRLALPVVALATFLQSMIPHYGFLFPLRCIVGIFSGAVIPTLYAALHKNTSAEIQGSIMGFASSAAVLGNLVGPILCSLIASYWSIPSAFVVGGGLIAFVYFHLILYET